MKSEDFTNISLDELKKKEKTLKVSSPLLVGIIIVQVARCWIVSDL